MNTIQKLIDAANNGDTVVIPDGWYRETVYLSKVVHLWPETMFGVMIEAPEGEPLFVVLPGVTGCTIKDFRLSTRGCPVFGDVHQERRP